MLDFLVGFLPDALGALVKSALLLVASGLVVALLLRRFGSRKALFVRTFGRPAGNRPVEVGPLADDLRDRLRSIWEAHRSNEGLHAQGEATSLADPRRRGEDLGSRAVSLLASGSPLGFLVGLSARVWPVLEVEGEVVVGDGGRLVCCARLRRGDRFFHAWRVPVPGEGASGEGAGGAAAVAEELAHRIVLDTARLGILDASRSAGTRSWRAFRALTRAMGIWTSDAFDAGDPAQVERVDAKLVEALEHDPGYALAHYDRGILHLLTFRDAATNARARGHLERARRLAREQAAAASREKVFVDRTVEGLAALGIARTYSQDRHRFGRTDPAVVDRAREAAGEAVALLDRSPASLYALAFAWHCTETLEDILRGRRLYEEIVRREPDRHPAVHNNLGYILMVGGERLRDRGREEEARAWWAEAEREMRRTLRISGPGRPTRRFSLANLGNLHRLRGRTDEAERAYLAALGPEPEASTYTDGLNELARLYAETGRRAEAERFHRLALASTDDDAHRAKLAREMEAAWGSGRRGDPAEAGARDPPPRHPAA